MASAVAPLISAALVATDHVQYRIHPGIAEAIHAVIPEPVMVAVDEQLAAWWTAVVAGWETAPPSAGEDTSHVTVRASVAAARYLLRRHHWDAASCLLERALLRDGYSMAAALAAILLLRRIAKATGAGKTWWCSVPRSGGVDPDEAETLLRRAYHQATTDGEYQLASTTAGELVTLLRDQGRLLDALAMAGQKIEHQPGRVRGLDPTQRSRPAAADTQPARPP